MNEYFTKTIPTIDEPVFSVFKPGAASRLLLDRAQRYMGLTPVATAAREYVTERVIDQHITTPGVYTVVIAFADGSCFCTDVEVELAPAKLQVKV